MITSPTLIIYGQESIFSLKAADTIDRGIKHSTLIKINNSSHFPYMESWAKFVEEIKRFLGTEK